MLQTPYPHHPCFCVHVPQVGQTSTVRNAVLPHTQLGTPAGQLLPTCSAANELMFTNVFYVIELSRVQPGSPCIVHACTCDICRAMHGYFYTSAGLLITAAAGCLQRHVPTETITLLLAVYP